MELGSMSRDQIRQVQTALNSQGAKIQADGVAGPKTIQALQDFKSTKGLGADQMLDDATIAALNLDATAFRSAH